MTQQSATVPVLCRPAVESDRAEVFEFCRGIWEGEDYVPLVWDEWFRDPNGVLAVAEYNGHAIGCTKVSRLSKGQWWLEGFRVDPAYQGLKVGTHLHNYATDWWLANGEGAVRLMTDAGNFAVHHLCARTGYAKINEVCGYRAPPLEETVGSFRPISDTQAAAAFAMESESIRSTDGLVDLGWRICKPNAEVFAAYAKEDADYAHLFYWWKDGQGLFSAWKNEEEDKRTLFLGVAACALSDLPALLSDVRKLAAGQGFDSIFQIAFDMPQITSPLLAAGFEKRWKRSNAFIFEKNHPDRA